MIDFEPTEEQTLMVTAVSQLAEKLRGAIRRTEEERGLSEETRKTAFEMGLGGAVSVPESHGGAGLGLVTAVLLDEALAAGDPAAPFALGGPGAFASAIAELGTAEQASAWITRLSAHDRCGAVAWSEARPNRTRPGLSALATKDGDAWVLRGEKAFVLNADRADAFVVFAQVDEAKGWSGVGAFVVDAKADGVRVGARKSTLGLDAVGACDVTLEGVRITNDDRLLGGDEFTKAALRFFVKEGLKVASRAVGLSQSAVDIALEYVSNRRAFGKPIGHFQAVAFTLADRAIDIDGARGLLRRAASLWDAFAAGTAQERDALLTSAYAIAASLEGAMRAGDDAVQLHGGAGFMRDYPVEKLMRDAKQLALCVMTKEQADQLAAAIELDMPLDPALVLPTPDLQAVFT
ncbi:MAG: hypothetical protein HOW73_23890 [Polyangiaceae bacterium]|nr:hypothetical protein [Polyangiaceae bacterium]